MSSTDIETADQCGWYRRVLELPVEVVPRTRRIVVHRIDGLVDAVVMPSPLGERVATWLAMDRQLGPVIEHRDTARMTFVTGPPDGYEHTIFATLLRLNVSLGGTHIVLPSPSDGGSGVWRWLFLPCNGFRPVMRIVLDAVVAVSAR
ncbi:DNA-directed RNA polymerase subunit beta [Nocardia australiensis]|uniref:DNA-directed RNA polymerase subunit beta n=1 Tax=Nocardia australiensis TaxID=2887191 RepID=UPI001D1413ED|nr:DNA-directed RNA polymerase subunit beta [Nocardia australiensis]